mmetsp:Transcript_11109/g.39266  ORF Transcript_11109/g.39266 Transcript_11109/m.39266 type:complete len:257 (-) Transcript_11109:112-882(-)
MGGSSVHDRILGLVDSGLAQQPSEQLLVGLSRSLRQSASPSICSLGARWVRQRCEEAFLRLVVAGDAPLLLVLLGGQQADLSEGLGGAPQDGCRVLHRGRGAGPHARRSEAACHADCQGHRGPGRGERRGADPEAQARRGGRRGLLPGHFAAHALGRVARDVGQLRRGSAAAPAEAASRDGGRGDEGRRSRRRGGRGGGGGDGGRGLVRQRPDVVGHRGRRGESARHRGDHVGGQRRGGREVERSSQCGARRERPK